MAPFSTKYRRPITRWCKLGFAEAGVMGLSVLSPPEMGQRSQGPSRIRGLLGDPRCGRPRQGTIPKNDGSRLEGTAPGHLIIPSRARKMGRFCGADARVRDADSRLAPRDVSAHIQIASDRLSGLVSIPGSNRPDPSGTSMRTLPDLVILCRVRARRRAATCSAWNRNHKGKGGAVSRSPLEQCRSLLGCSL